MSHEFRELMKDQWFKGLVLFFIVVTLFAAFIGWSLKSAFFTWANERNAIKQTSTVMLTVVNKCSEGSLMVGMMPTRYYLVLSNDEKVYMIYDDLLTYEEGQEYMFEQTVTSLVTSRIKPHVP